MTRTEYDGDNPLRLANDIDAALTKYGLGSDRRICETIHFFEGELRLIAECLRCASPQKVAKQWPGSTHGVSRKEEIEKYLKQLKDADRRVIDAGCSAVCAGCSGRLLPPSPPAEQATAREDQPGEACASDGTGNTSRRKAKVHVGKRATY